MRDMQPTRQEEQPIRDLSFTVQIFKEGETYVAYAPEFDVSSCGASADEARKNIRDAVQGFLEASQELGTLHEILEEAGYQRKGENWRPPEFISLDRVTLNFK